MIRALFLLEKAVARFLLFLLLSFALAGTASAELQFYEQVEVNGHPGFQSAWSVSGELDKVILVVPGFDLVNDEPPAQAFEGVLGPVAWFIGLFGWDVIYFEYVDGAIDINDNADNLSVFIDYLNSVAEPDYHLALVGGSMGGIVGRTLFAAHNDNLGVDTFITIDSPHKGVMLSTWVNDLAELAINVPAARQMQYGHADYLTHYGWLESIEQSDDYRQRVLAPMSTLAITLSEQKPEGWVLPWSDVFLHGPYKPVSSYFELESLRSTFIPYHSAAMLDDGSLERSFDRDGARYQYRSLIGSYFDRVVTNPRDKHGAPDQTVVQAVLFALEHGPD